MTEYKLIVHEEVEVTYSVNADSLEEAKELWDRGVCDSVDPHKELLACSLSYIIDENGCTFDADGIEDMVDA